MANTTIPFWLRSRKASKALGACEISASGAGDSLRSADMIERRNVARNHQSRSGDEINA
jgi:hypothetical protein